MAKPFQPWPLFNRAYYCLGSPKTRISLLGWIFGWVSLLRLRLVTRRLTHVELRAAGRQIFNLKLPATSESRFWLCPAAGSRNGPRGQHLETRPLRYLPLIQGYSRVIPWTVNTSRYRRVIPGISFHILRFEKISQDMKRYRYLFISRDIST